jgi:hypothetical protein
MSTVQAEMFLDRVADDQDTGIAVGASVGVFGFVVAATAAAAAV